MPPKPSTIKGLRSENIPADEFRRLAKIAKRGMPPDNTYEGAVIRRLVSKGKLPLPPSNAPSSSRPAPRTNAGSVDELTNSGVDALTNAGSVDQLINARRAGPASDDGARVRASSRKNVRSRVLAWWRRLKGSGRAAST